MLSPPVHALHMKCNPALLLLLLLLLCLQVRMYVDGQLAGLYPIFYTFYTASHVGGAAVS
jgi:hypothetical protein